MNYFKPVEFESPDAPGSGVNMDAGFLAKLNAARSLCPFAWNPSKGGGYRTKAYNASIKGAPDSWHMKGKAVDIKCRDAVRRRMIVAAAIQAGIGGIEVCDAHIHLDDGLPRLWSDKSR